MNIIVVGCGKVGMALVEQLSKEGHDITIIDKNATRVQEIAGLYDIMGMAGNGASYSVQMEAGIENTDLIIAVTESDELNLLCCTVAKRVGNCAAIARVRTPDYSTEVSYLREKLGLAMIINPEQTAASEISSLLCFPGAIGIDSFAGGKVEMLRFRIPCGCILDNMALKDVSARIHCQFLICAVDRDNEVCIPGGNFVLKSGDVISIVASRENTSFFLKKLNINTNSVKNTMIIGGGKISLYLAEMLVKQGIAVKVIEKNPKRCQELSELLPEATVICGDGSEETLLQEERIDSMDSFVALTNMDEENILLSLFAKKHVSKKVITKINRQQLTEVIRNLELDSVVYPKLLTAQKILQYVRAAKNSIGSNVKTLYRLFDDKVEALEFNIYEKSKITEIPLQDLHIKKGLLICAITRNGRILIPDGQTQILPGDTMIVVTTQLGLQDAQDIVRD